MAETYIDRLKEQYGDRLTVNEDGSVTWDLLYPIKTKDGEIGTINLRRPKAKEITRMKGSSDSAKTLWVIATLSGIAPPVLEEVDGQDFAVLGQIFSGFMGVSPPTGSA